PDRDLQLDVSDLGAGVYILKVQMTEGISIQRFIKE
ncbi:MAG: T9SS type A sorting domain-containing protein, partial [Bacteroidales bacterium]|nr:T9SS type A sorting domain-containing protein [Bacteroidales bacterium]